MPAGAIEQQYGMGTVLDVPADLVDVELHGKGIDIGQRQVGALGRADGAEQIGVPVALIGRLPWPGSPSCPEPSKPILLPDTSLVLVVCSQDSGHWSRAFFDLNES